MSAVHSLYADSGCSASSAASELNLRLSAQEIDPSRAGLGASATLQKKLSASHGLADLVSRGDEVEFSVSACMVGLLGKILRSLLENCHWSNRIDPLGRRRQISWPEGGVGSMSLC